MEPRKIDEQIREYYQGQRLPEHARARLVAMIGAGKPPARGDVWWWLRTAVAASFILIITSVALWLTVFREPLSPSPRQLASAVARRAAWGHNEKQELEFRVRECAELQAKMKSLDFTPVEPAMVKEMNMQLVGARYTTIEGEIAAQMLFVDSKGVPCTLYEVRPVDRLARLPISEHQVDGVRVNVWREKGLLMVLARPMA